MTCWRRLQDWQTAGVFDRLHQALLAELNAAGRIDWSRACVDASHVRAKREAPAPDPARSNRGKTGSKHHLICDSGGVPLAVTLTRGDVDRRQPQRHHPAHPLLDTVPPIRGRRGRPRRKPDVVVADHS
jgi:transposase